MERETRSKKGKNNFREFFFQFLMTFLGVTLGFFSFSLREYLSNKSKEKANIVSIKKDLAADTSGLNVFIPTLFNRIRQFDTLISLLQIRGYNTNGSDLYYYARTSTQSRAFQTINNTISGLKNSGNLDLISNQNVIKTMVGFQKTVDLYLNLAAIDTREAEMLYPLLGTLFDASVFDSMFKSRENALAYSIDSAVLVQTVQFEKPKGNPQLISHDKKLINLLIFYLHERKSTFIGEITFLQEEKKEAAQLIQLINKEYNLKSG